MSDEFAGPGSAASLDMADLHGHLLLIQPYSTEEMDTVHGPATAVRADIFDLTDGKDHLDVLLFSRVVVGSLRTRLGQKVLAELGQGVAKPGKTAPWQLIDRSGDTKAVAKAKARIGLPAKPTLASQIEQDKAAQAKRNLEQAFGTLTEEPPF